MKSKALSVVFFLISNTLYAECINSSEKALLSKSIEFFNDYYGDVVNFIDCKNQMTSLDKFVCKNPDYLSMFYLLSQANVYAYENATKTEVNHRTFNKKHMIHLVKEHQNEKNINSDHLCFDLKSAAFDGPGILEYPYKMTGIDNHLFFIQENKHGAVLTDRDGYKIYLGISCDVADSKNNKGRWFHEANTYTIEINDTQLDFSADSLNLEQYDCHK